MLENDKRVQSDILCISDNNYSKTVKKKNVRAAF